MPHDRLFAEDGTDVGETRLATYVGPGDVIHVGAGPTLRVVELVPVEELGGLLDEYERAA